MENEFDPQRGMVWYKILKVLLIVQIPFAFILLYFDISASGLTIQEFFDYFPAYSVIATINLFGSVILRVILFINLLEYSIQAPRLCLIIIGFTFVCDISLIFFYGSYAGVVEECVGNMIGSFIFFLPNYIYLRNRLIKSYWKNEVCSPVISYEQINETIHPNNEHLLKKQDQVMQDTTEQTKAHFISNEVKESPNYSSADEILKFKHLLDSGAITEEEYDAKKKQLLKL